MLIADSEVPYSEKRITPGQGGSIIVPIDGAGAVIRGPAGFSSPPTVQRRITGSHGVHVDIHQQVAGVCIAKGEGRSSPFGSSVATAHIKKRARADEAPDAAVAALQQLAASIENRYLC